MSAIAEDILKILEKQTEPMSIHDVIIKLPHYEIHTIKTEVWNLAANNLIKFDWN